MKISILPRCRAEAIAVSTGQTRGVYSRAPTACACWKSNSHIQMMKSAKKWHRQNATNGMYRSRRRRVLVDRKVRASRIIVGRVRSQQMAEMPLAEHDNVVKTFPPDRTDRPFTISVLHHGDRGAVGRSRMLIARRRRMKTSP